MNQERYVGLSSGLEIGYALASETPIYALEALDYEAMEIDDFEMRQLLTDTVTVLPPEDVAAHYRETWQTF